MPLPWEQGTIVIDDDSYKFENRVNIKRKHMTNIMNFIAQLENMKFANNQLANEVKLIILQELLAEHRQLYKKNEKIISKAADAASMIDKDKAQEKEHIDKYIAIYTETNQELDKVITTLQGQVNKLDNSKQYTPLRPWGVGVKPIQPLQYAMRTPSRKVISGTTPLSAGQPHVNQHMMPDISAFAGNALVRTEERKIETERLLATRPVRSYLSSATNVSEYGFNKLHISKEIIDALANKFNNINEAAVFLAAAPALIKDRQLDFYLTILLKLTREKQEEQIKDLADTAILTMVKQAIKEHQNLTKRHNTSEERVKMIAQYKQIAQIGTYIFVSRETEMFKKKFLNQHLDQEQKYKQYEDFTKELAAQINDFNIGNSAIFADLDLFSSAADKCTAGKCSIGSHLQDIAKQIFTGDQDVFGNQSKKSTALIAQGNLYDALKFGQKDSKAHTNQVAANLKRDLPYPFIVVTDAMFSRQGAADQIVDQKIQVRYQEQLAAANKEYLEGLKRQITAATKNKLKLSATDDSMLPKTRDKEWKEWEKIINKRGELFSSGYSSKSSNAVSANIWQRFVEAMYEGINYKNLDGIMDQRAKHLRIRQNVIDRIHAVESEPIITMKDGNFSIDFVYLGAKNIAVELQRIGSDSCSNDALDSTPLEQSGLIATRADLIQGIKDWQKKKELDRAQKTHNNNITGPNLDRNAEREFERQYKEEQDKITKKYQSKAIPSKPRNAMLQLIKIFENSNIFPNMHTHTFEGGSLEHIKNQINLNTELTTQVKDVYLGALAKAEKARAINVLQPQSINIAEEIKKTEPQSPEAAQASNNEAIVRQLIELQYVYAHKKDLTHYKIPADLLMAIDNLDFSRVIAILTSNPSLAKIITEAYEGLKQLQLLPDDAKNAPFLHPIITKTQQLESLEEKKTKLLGQLDQALLNHDDEKAQKEIEEIYYKAYLYTIGNLLPNKSTNEISSILEDKIKPQVAIMAEEVIYLRKCAKEGRSPTSEDRAIYYDAINQIADAWNADKTALDQLFKMRNMGFKIKHTSNGVTEIQVVYYPNPETHRLYEDADTQEESISQNNQAVIVKNIKINLKLPEKKSLRYSLNKYPGMESAFISYGGSRGIIAPLFLLNKTRWFTGSRGEGGGYGYASLAVNIDTAEHQVGKELYVAAGEQDRFKKEARTMVDRRRITSIPEPNLLNEVIIGQYEYGDKFNYFLKSDKPRSTTDESALYDQQLDKGVIIMPRAPGVGLDQLLRKEFASFAVGDQRWHNPILRKNNLAGHLSLLKRWMAIGKAINAKLTEFAAAGMVHGDLKPENIFVDESVDPPLITFIDKATTYILSKWDQQLLVGDKLGLEIAPALKQQLNEKFAQSLPAVSILKAADAGPDNLIYELYPHPDHQNGKDKDKYYVAKVISASGTHSIMLEVQLLESNYSIIGEPVVGAKPRLKYTDAPFNGTVGYMSSALFLRSGDESEEHCYQRLAKENPWFTDHDSRDVLLFGVLRTDSYLKQPKNRIINDYVKKDLFKPADLSSTYGLAIANNEKFKQAYAVERTSGHLVAESDPIPAESQGSALMYLPPNSHEGESLGYGRYFKYLSDELRKEVAAHNSIVSLDGSEKVALGSSEKQALIDSKKQLADDIDKVLNNYYERKLAQKVYTNKEFEQEIQVPLENLLMRFEQLNNPNAAHEVQKQTLFKNVLNADYTSNKNISKVNDLLINGSDNISRLQILCTYPANKQDVDAVCALFALTNKAEPFLNETKLNEFVLQPLQSKQDQDEGDENDVRLKRDASLFKECIKHGQEDILVVLLGIIKTTTTKKDDLLRIVNHYGLLHYALQQDMTNAFVALVDALKRIGTADTDIFAAMRYPEQNEASGDLADIDKHHCLELAIRNKSTQQLATILLVAPKNLNQDQLVEQPAEISKVLFLCGERGYQELFEQICAKFTGITTKYILGIQPASPYHLFLQAEKTVSAINWDQLAKDSGEALWFLLKPGDNDAEDMLSKSSVGSVEQKAGNYALLIAAKNRNIAGVEALINLGAKNYILSNEQWKEFFMQRDSEGKNVLNYYLENGKESSLEKLLKLITTYCSDDAHAVVTDLLLNAHPVNPLQNYLTLTSPALMTTATTAAKNEDLQNTLKKFASLTQLLTVVCPVNNNNKNGEKHATADQQEALIAILLANQHWLSEQLIDYDPFHSGGRSDALQNLLSRNDALDYEHKILLFNELTVAAELCGNDRAAQIYKSIMSTKEQLQSKEPPAKTIDVAKILKRVAQQRTGLQPYTRVMWLMDEQLDKQTKIDELIAQRQIKAKEQQEVLKSELGDSLDSRVELEKNRADKVEKENEQLKLQQQRIAVETDSLNNIIKDQEQIIANHTLKLEALHVDLGAAKEEQENNQIKIDALQVDIDSLKQSKDLLDKNNMKNQSTQQGLTQEIDRLKNKVIETTAEYNNKQSEINAIKIKLTNSQQLVDASNIEVGQLKLRISGFERSNKDLESKIKALEEELLNAHELTDEARKAQQATIKNQNVVLYNFKEQLKNKQNEYDNLKNECNNLLTKRKQHENEMIEQQENLGKVTQQLEDTKKELGKNQKLLSANNKKLQETNALNKDLQQQIQQSETVCAQKENEILEYNQQLKTVNGTTELLEAEVVTLKMQTEEERATRNNLEKVVSELSNALSDSKKRILYTIIRSYHKTTKLAKELEREKENFEEKLMIDKSKGSELNSKIIQLEQDINAQNEQQQQQNQLGVIKAQEIQSKNTELEKLNNEQQQQLKTQYQKTIDDLNKVEDEKNRSIAILKEEHNRFQLECDQNYQEVLSAKEEAISKGNCLAGQIKSLQEQLKEMENNNKNENDANKEQLATEQQKLVQASEQLQQLTEQITLQQKQIANHEIDLQKNNEQLLSYLKTVMEEMRDSEANATQLIEENVILCNENYYLRQNITSLFLTWSIMRNDFFAKIQALYNTQEDLFHKESQLQLLQCAAGQDDDAQSMLKMISAQRDISVQCLRADIARLLSAEENQPKDVQLTDVARKFNILVDSFAGVEAVCNLAKQLEQATSAADNLKSSKLVMNVNAESNDPNNTNTIPDLLKQLENCKQSLSKETEKYNNMIITLGEIQALEISIQQVAGEQQSTVQALVAKQIANIEHRIEPQLDVLHIMLSKLADKLKTVQAKIAGAQQIVPLEQNSSLNEQSNIEPHQNIAVEQLKVYESDLQQTKIAYGQIQTLQYNYLHPAFLSAKAHLRDNKIFYEELSRYCVTEVEKLKQGITNLMETLSNYNINLEDRLKAATLLKESTCYKKLFETALTMIEAKLVNEENYGINASQAKGFVKQRGMLGAVALADGLDAAQEARLDLGGPWQVRRFADKNSWMQADQPAMQSSAVSVNDGPVKIVFNKTSEVFGLYDGPHGSRIKEEIIREAATKKTRLEVIISATNKLESAMWTAAKVLYNFNETHPPRKGAIKLSGCHDPETLRNVYAALHLIAKARHIKLEGAIQFTDLTNIKPSIGCEIEKDVIELQNKLKQLTAGNEDVCAKYLSNLTKLEKDQQQEINQAKEAIKQITRNVFKKNERPNNDQSLPILKQHMFFHNRTQSNKLISAFSYKRSSSTKY